MKRATLWGVLLIVGLGAVAVGRRIYVPGGGIRPGPGRSSILEAFEP